MKEHQHLLAWHFVGGLLGGAYACPDSVPRSITDERLQRVVEAVIAVAYVDQTWPVDVGRIVDVLQERGVYEDIGGSAFLIDLMASWTERVERAEYLGAVMALCQIALDAINQELATNDELAALINRRSDARERASAALAVLTSTTEAA